MYCGVDYFQGGDLFGERANNIDDCIAICNNNPDCNFISYQAEIDNGSNGTCWLKSRPGVRRDDKTILGMFRVAARESSGSPSASSEPSSTSSTIVTPSTATSPSISTPFKSVSSSTSHTAIITSSSQAHPASTTGSVSSPTRSFSATAHAESDGHTSAKPQSWFGKAHPCHPVECSTPVTTYGRTSFPPTSITSSSQEITVTRSVVMTKVLSSSKTSIILPSTKTSSFVEYSGASTIYLSSKVPTRASTYSYPLDSKYSRPSSSRTYSKPHHMASSNKSYTEPFSASSSTATEMTFKDSPYSCAIFTGRILCTGFDDTVSTKFTFTTTTLNLGTSTTTIYTTLSLQSAVTSGSKMHKSFMSMTSKTFMPVPTGGRTVTSDTTDTGRKSASPETVVSNGSVSTNPITALVPTSTHGAATSTLTRWLTSKPTISSQITEFRKSTASSFSLVASSSSKISNSTANRVSNASSGVSVSSKTIGDQWRNPSTWYVPTPTRQSTKQIPSSSTRSKVTAGHYSHLGSSSAATIKASSSGKAYSIPVYPAPSSKDALPATSQGYVPASSVPTSASHTTILTAREFEDPATLLQSDAQTSSSIILSPQPTNLVTPTKSGPVTKSVNVSWSWTSTPKPSSDRSAGQHLVFGPSVVMAVVFAGSFVLPFVA